jgi:hypothetical protein
MSSPTGRNQGRSSRIASYALSAISLLAALATVAATQALAGNTAATLVAIPIGFAAGYYGFVR